MKQIPINTIRENGRFISLAILSGYYKFYGATILRGFNGATAVIDINYDF